MNGEELEEGMRIKVWIGKKDTGYVEEMNDGDYCRVDKNSDGMLVIVDEEGNWVADIGYGKEGVTND